MRAVRLGLAASGTAAMAYAVWSAVLSPDLTVTRNATFLLLVLVLHDAVLLPVFLLAGALVRRLVPAGVRAVVQVALIATASVTLVALPLVLGYGRTADLPSALPLNYGRGLLITLAVIWAGAGAAIVIRRVRSGRGRSHHHPPQPARGS